MKTLRHDDRRRRSRARRLPLGGLAGKRRDQTSDSVKTTRLSKPPGDEGGRRDQARKGGSASHPCGTGATTPQHACSDSGTSRRITVMLALLLSQEQSANIRLTRRRSALASLPPPSPGISTQTKARPRDLGLTTVIPYQDDRGSADLQDRRAADFPALDAQENLVRLFERKDLRLGADRDARGQFQEFLGVPAGVIGDADDAPLSIEQLVWEGRNRAHVNRVDRQRAAAAEPRQSDRNELPRRREGDRGIQSRAGIVFSAAGPGRSHLDRETPVMLLPREDEDLASPVESGLTCQVRRSSEPEEAQPAARLDTGKTQRPIPDDPRAKERRALQRGEACRQTVDPLGARHNYLGVAAVPVAPSEGRLLAEVLAPRAAEAADPAGRSHPAHADGIPRRESPDSRSQSDNLPRGLMPGNDGQASRNLALQDVQVRPADAAGLDGDRDLAG